MKNYAARGNPDESKHLFNEFFNMEWLLYYRFKKGILNYYSLNCNYMYKKQIDSIKDKLSTDISSCTIAFFHHPPYSSGGKHGSDTKLREVVEPLFLQHGVNFVLAGHEHFYERIKPQKGIHYFISGSGGKLRKGDIKKGSPLTAKAYDKDMSFMLAEISDEQMHFQVISRTGETVDAGVVVHQRKKNGNNRVASTSQ